MQQIWHVAKVSNLQNDLICRNEKAGYSRKRYR
jgi:hypothetical protein